MGATDSAECAQRSNSKREVGVSTSLCRIQGPASWTQGDSQGHHEQMIRYDVGTANSPSCLDSGTWIQDSRPRIQHPGFRGLNLGTGARDLGFWIQDESVFLTPAQDPAAWDQTEKHWIRDPWSCAFLSNTWRMDSTTVQTSTMFTSRRIPRVWVGFSRAR